MWRHVALCVVGAAIATPSLAADPVVAPIVVVAPPVVEPVRYFAGPYIGLHGGWGWSVANSIYVDNAFNPPNCGFNFFWGCPVDVDPRGAFVGGQIGWNFVSPGGLMVGIEGDYSFARLHDSGVGAFFFDIFATEIILNVDQLATVQGRIGFVMGRVMPFVTAGWGWAHAVRSAFNPVFIGPVPAVDTRWHQGWTLGGGLALALNEHWTVQGEYRFFNGNTQTYALGFAGGTNVDLNIHTVRFSVNFGYH